MERTDRNQIKEPYRPEDTPTPPQVINPNMRYEQNEPGEPANERDRKQPEIKPEIKIQDTGRRLGDELEITDETTI